MARTIDPFRRIRIAAPAALVLAATVVAGGAQAPNVGSEVSIAEIEKTLHAIDVDRTAASDGERSSADYLVRKLTDYGVAHTSYDADLYLSWPGRAEITVGALTIRGKTAAFAAATPVTGVQGRLMFDAKPTRNADRSLAFDAAVRGAIPVVRGIADTEALVLAAQRAGAAAVVQIDATDTLHEDIVTTIWGTPTAESAARMPRIPYVCVTKSDGDRLAAAAKPSGTATVVAEVTRGWRTIPIVVADVPGRTPDFVLVATHLDAWYHGMTDTAGAVASILDMARVLQAHRGELARGVRFAWWTGHSFGRYAGSGWYVDHAFRDLDEHCVAYTNLDGPGRRKSRVDGVSAGGWPGLADYAQESAVRLTGKTPGPGRGGDRLFRPGRDSDSAFQGLGIPMFSIGVPAPDRSSGDIDADGRVAYWHTPEDTFDKLDMKVLELDTRYRLAQIYDLVTMGVLPHRLAPIAASYVAALRDLASAGPFLDLGPTIDLAAALDDAARRFDAAAKPTAAATVAEYNRLVVRLTRELNSTLYTKAGRFDQDPAAELPILPLLARAKDLPAIPRDSDDFGFLRTELLRARNNVDTTLRAAVRAIDRYLAPSGSFFVPVSIGRPL